MRSLGEFYSSSFYSGQSDGSATSADIILPIIFPIVLPKSVLDVGCGIGTWLATASRLGIQDVRGIDGDWVNSVPLKIPSEKFTATDLSQPFDLGQRFDLVISLEVAEHLPPTVAEPFVESLARHGDVILFSAAIPHQGGTNHVNEQWPSYWIKRFANLGYSVFDCIRSQIWEEQQVSPWYAQNIFLFANASGLARRPEILSASERYQALPLHIVHPGMLYLASHPGIKTAARLTLSAVQRKLSSVMSWK